MKNEDKILRVEESAAYFHVIGWSGKLYKTGSRTACYNWLHTLKGEAAHKWEEQNKKDCEESEKFYS